MQDCRSQYHHLIDIVKKSLFWWQVRLGPTSEKRQIRRGDCESTHRYSSTVRVPLHPAAGLGQGQRWPWSGLGGGGEAAVPLPPGPGLHSVHSGPAPPEPVQAGRETAQLYLPIEFSISSTMERPV